MKKTSLVILFIFFNSPVSAINWKIFQSPTGDLFNQKLEFWFIVKIVRWTPK